MKRLLRYLTLLLVMSLFCSCCAQAQTPLTYAKGDKIQDFTFTTHDGQTLSLSDILKEKEAVLINIWATWCGPCRSEFPYMQEAYEQYQDKVEIIALSCEPSDTPDVLAAFADEYGLTFKIGQDPVDFLSALRTSSIPTSLLVDRFGTICFVESGAQPNAAAFTRLFDFFLGDHYTESVLIDGIPPMKPDIAPADEAALSSAIGAAAVNPDNPYYWPVTIVETDERSAVMTTNAGHASTTSAITAKLEAKAGDAVAITFRTSTEPIFDLLHISVNGTTVKVFGGEHDWMTYAVPVHADGEQTITLSYVKNASGNAGKDAIWVDSIEVLSGGDAEAALAANPSYPTSADTALYLTTPSAREVTISDPNNLLLANFGSARYYILNGNTASFTATLSNANDPEATFFFSDYDGAILPVVSCMSGDGYVISAGVDSADTTGYVYTSMRLYGGADLTLLDAIVYFPDETNLNLFVDGNKLGEWSYVASEKEVIPSTKQIGSAIYTLHCIDQDGMPVAGAMLQICNDATCEVVTSDANGNYRFTADAYAWEIHVLRAPAGYTADSTDTQIAPLTGGDMVFTFTKN